MAPRDLTATFNYLIPSKQSSLYRNGQVLLHRDPDGNDSGVTGLDLEAVSVTVHDARALGQRPMLDQQGFELLDAPLADTSLDFFDSDTVARRYYPERADLVCQAVGASYGVAFDHNVRWNVGKRSKKRLEGGQVHISPTRDHLIRCM